MGQIRKRANGRPALARFWHWAVLVAAIGILPAQGAAPANDEFLSADPYVEQRFSLSGDSTGAQFEPGEPFHTENEGPGGGSSVWFSWVAPSGVRVILDTTGSSFDTLLAVYSGDAFENLVRVAANDSQPGAQSSRLA